MPQKEYNFKDVEAKWQKYWEDTGLFRMDPASPKPKFYCLVMFPYPSGTLHVGHGRNYIIGDVVARYKLVAGFNVLTPMGWDAFGLPAENAAIKNNAHPADWTRPNIAAMKTQIRTWGVGYDWDREVSSCDPEYYKWTQWVFLKLYERGLAYKRMSPVNWCPSCSTGLANEEVVDGCCERCGAEAEKRDMEQWFFKITDYAQPLLDDLSLLGEWPERVRVMQANWIGRSEGARIDFKVAHTGDLLPCFTTRPDTLWGVTFMSLAPEHPLVPDLVKDTPREREVADFIAKCKKQKAMDRAAEGAVKEGVFTGRYIINPVNGDRVPLWVANYALMEYGTGAVMAVPAHDQRDFEFAKKYGLAVKVVIQPPGRKLDPTAMTQAYVEDGVQVNSGPFDGMNNREAMPKIIRFLEEKGLGAGTVSYRIRDWLVSRQRYWGAPIPIVYCPTCGKVPVRAKDLPVRLPEKVEYRPTGESPLAGMPEFVNTNCPVCGGPAKRETDTIAQWLCSCWYFLRYLSPKDDRRPFERALVDRWLPVDQYIGGIEHAVLHLLYSRFIVKVLHDANEVSFKEPFRGLFTQGMICKKSYWCPTCRKHVHPHEETETKCPECSKDPVRISLEKMSKSKGNVVSPEPLIEKYGADTLRLYTLFIGPPQKDAEWNDRAVSGGFRFLNRLWNRVAEREEDLKTVPRVETLQAASLQGDEAALFRKTHQTIKKVTEDIEKLWQFNTAISAVMELMNMVDDFDPGQGQKPGQKPGFSQKPGFLQRFNVFRFALESAVRLLSPFVPHVAEELWGMLGHPPTVFRVPWPKYDPAAIVADEIELPVQINGKLRSRITVPADAAEDEVRARALEDEKVKRHIGPAKVRKVIVVPKKLVSVVVG
jgi:leucyl-tRNA synthetase